MGVARSARYFATAMMSKACVFTENLRKLFKMWEKTKASFCMLQSPCSAAHLELCSGPDVAGSEEGPPGHGRAAREGMWEAGCAGTPPGWLPAPGTGAS